MPESEERFTLRLPASLSAKLDRAAGGTTPKNTEIVRRLEASFGRGRAIDAMFDAVEWPLAVRVKHGNTTLDIERVLGICNAMTLDRIVLAARADELNNAVLVMLLQSAQGPLTLVVDHTHNNMARRPRQLDIQMLTKGLQGAGMLELCEACSTFVPDTRELSPADAAKAIIGVGDPKQFDSFTPFLKVLAAGVPFNEAEFVTLAKRKRPS